MRYVTFPDHVNCISGNKYVSQQTWADGASLPTRRVRRVHTSIHTAEPNRREPFARVHCEHILMWSQCTGRTRRSGPVPSNGRVVRPTIHATDYNKGMLYACLPGKGKQPVPARLRASANRANNPLQLTGSNKFNPRASIIFIS